MCWTIVKGLEEKGKYIVSKAQVPEKMRRMQRLREVICVLANDVLEL